MNKLLIFVLVILVFDIAVHIRIRSCNVKPIIQQVLYTSDKYTVNEHPFLAANYVRNANYKNKVKLGLIGSLIETHMGQWDSGVNLKPVTNLQNFVHLCDYLASRKFLEVTFN